MDRAAAPPEALGCYCIHAHGVRGRRVDDLACPGNASAQDRDDGRRGGVTSKPM